MACIALPVAAAPADQEAPAAPPGNPRSGPSSPLVGSLRPGGGTPAKSPLGRQTAQPGPQQFEPVVWRGEKSSAPRRRGQFSLQMLILARRHHWGVGTWGNSCVGDFPEASLDFLSRLRKSHTPRHAHRPSPAAERGVSQGNEREGRVGLATARWRKSHAWWIHFARSSPRGESALPVEGALRDFLVKHWTDSLLKWVAEPS